jgi:hypothetical protein
MRPSGSTTGGRLVQWLLAIPQLGVVAVLFFASAICVVIAFFAVLFAGRRPDGAARLRAQRESLLARGEAYTLLLRDQYPPFARVGLRSTRRTGRDRAVTRALTVH